MSTERYTVSVLTFGPGEHPFLKFGHNAVLVYDRKSARTEVYNFGTFDFRNPHLIQDFLKGRLTYWLSVSDRTTALAPYRLEGRSAVSQELSLSEAAKVRLVDELRQTARPENREYRYDYYRNNCSTKIRDLIDEASGGSLRAVSEPDADLNWRQHTLRLTQDDTPVALGLHILLGPETDRPRDVWEEMFLPRVLSDKLDDATIEIEGGLQPLVRRKKVELVAVERDPEPAEPPTWWGASLSVGVVLFALSFALMRLKRARGKWSRIATMNLWLLSGTWGFVSGFFSAAFLLLWTTDHQIAHANHNLLSMPPWALLLVPCAVLARWWKRAHRVAFLVSALSLATSLIGFLVLAFVPDAQDTSLFLALAAPIWLGLSLVHRKSAADLVAT